MQQRVDLGELPLGRPIRVSCACGTCFEPYTVTGVQSRYLYFPVRNFVLNIPAATLTEEIPGCLGIKAEILTEYEVNP